MYRPPLAATVGLLCRVPEAGPEAAGTVGRLVPQPRAFDMAVSEVCCLDAITGYRWAVLGVGVPGAQGIAGGTAVERAVPSSAASSPADRRGRSSVNMVRMSRVRSEAEFRSRYVPGMEPRL